VGRVSCYFGGRITDDYGIEIQGGKNKVCMVCIPHPKKDLGLGLVEKILKQAGLKEGS
jgi:hypothetical protein